MARILFLEDEVKTGKIIAQGLQEEGYEVEHASDGLQGLALYKKGNYDLIITDVLMPRMNGIDFCLEVRKHNTHIPILILSALGLTEDKIKGFDSGSDDYLIKPFDFKELLARIKALLKRTQDPRQMEQTLTYDNLLLNRDTKEVYRSGKMIPLTSKEFSLLEYFMLNQEHLLTKEQIIQHVWGFDFDTGTNILEVYISYLRNKVESREMNKLIHTRKGLGYILKSGEMA